MNGILSLIRSVPPLRRAARHMRLAIGRALCLEVPYQRFFTMSPDLLVALVRALDIQKQLTGQGRNLIDGHGYYEFGLFRGFSFWFAVGCSYEEAQSLLHLWRADQTRMQIFKGFYSEKMFRDLSGRMQFPPVSICLIDADLYESCVPILELIHPYLVDGSILLFDDYYQFGKAVVSGERRALEEFEARHPEFRKEYLFDYGWEGVAFVVRALVPAANGHDKAAANNREI